MPWAQGCAGTAISRLVALVPKPRVHLTRYHGVFAPYADVGIRCVMPTSGLCQPCVANPYCRWRSLRWSRHNQSASRKAMSVSGGR